MDLRRFEQRKKDHLLESLKERHQAKGLSGLDDLRLKHQPLPELDFEDVSMESLRLGATSTTPFYISGMTAGHDDAPRLNRCLATIAQQRGWAMGVGSQRRDLSQGGPHGGVDRWKDFRKDFPRLELFANLGLSQLIQSDLSAVQGIVDSLEAQALVIHLNPLQEVLQEEGTPQFKGGVAAVGRLCEKLSVPVIVKETGCGFSVEAAKRLSSVGIRAIDVSGMGGTHWGRIEGARAKSGGNPLRLLASETFANWGISTVQSVLNVSRGAPELEIWGSGGVRSGLDAARLLSLGCVQVGYAQPALKAALEGEDALDQWMELQEFELKTTLFCTGSQSPCQLKGRGDGQ